AVNSPWKRAAGRRSAARPGSWVGASPASCAPPDRRLGEKPPQFVNQAAWVVALDRVPRLLDPHPAACRQRARETFRVLIQEHVALRAPHPPPPPPHLMTLSPTHLAPPSHS